MFRNVMYISRIYGVFCLVQYKIIYIILKLPLNNYLTIQSMKIANIIIKIAWTSFIIHSIIKVNQNSDHIISTSYMS